MSQKPIAISDFLQDINNFNINKKKREDKLATLHGKPNEKYLLHIFKNPSHRFLEAFFRSIEIRAPLNHPTILPLTGFSYDESDFILIEPYLENGSLDKFMQDRQKGIDIPNLETIRSIIIFGLAAGLAYLHQNGIIHKHLDSEHILLDNEMHPKIIGTEKRFFEVINLDMDCITPFCEVCFISPECLEDHAVTGKTDVYSYSILLVSLFKFKLPFDPKQSKNKYMFLSSVTKGERPDITGDDIPEIWANLIKQCWKPDPLERPRSIEIVQRLMDGKDEFFNDPRINQEELSRYIESVTSGLDFSRL